MFVEGFEFEVVVVEDVPDVSDLQGCESYAEADDDGFLGLACSLQIGAVLGAGEAESVEHSSCFGVVGVGVGSHVVYFYGGFREVGVDDEFFVFVLF